jgi:hypothetical protein
VSRGVVLAAALPAVSKGREVVGEARRLPQLGAAAVEQFGPAVGAAVNSARASARDLGPALETARERITPTLESARDQVVTTVAPAIAEAVSTAFDRSEPIRLEALRRAEAALAALRGEQPRPAGRGAGAAVGLVALGAVLGAAGGWFAHRGGGQPAHAIGQPPLSPVAAPSATPERPVEAPSVS